MLIDVKLKDLRTGMVAINHWGQVGIVALKTNTTSDKNYIVYHDHAGQTLGDNPNSDCSCFISKLYKTKDGYPHYVINHSESLQSSTEEDIAINDQLELIYDSNFVIKVTMKDIEEKFGGKVKIIG